eukprot:4491699-Prymnesium_polylepis.1
MSVSLTPNASKLSLAISSPKMSAGSSDAQNVYSVSVACTTLKPTCQSNLYSGARALKSLTMPSQTWASCSSSPRAYHSCFLAARQMEPPRRRWPFVRPEKIKTNKTKCAVRPSEEDAESRSSEGTRGFMPVSSSLRDARKDPISTAGCIDIAA